MNIGHIVRAISSGAGVTGDLLQSFQTATNIFAGVEHSSASADLSVFALMQSATPSKAYVYRIGAGGYGAPVELAPSLYNERVRSVSVSGDGDTIVLGIAPSASPAISGGPTGYFKFCVYGWTGSDWALLHTKTISSQSGTTLRSCITAVSYDGSVIAYSDSSTLEISVYRRTLGNLLLVGTSPVTATATTLEMLADGTRLFAGFGGETVGGVSQSGRVSFFKIEAAQLIKQSDLAYPGTPVANLRWGERIVCNFAGDIAMLKANGATDSIIYVFTRSGDSWVLWYQIPPEPGLYTVKYAFSRNMQHLAVGRRTGDFATSGIWIYKRVGASWVYVRTIDQPSNWASTYFDQYLYLSNDGQRLLGFSLKSPAGTAETYAYLFD